MATSIPNAPKKFPEYRVITFYKFLPLENLPELRTKLLQEARKLELRGTILIASEGLNSTLAGSEEGTQKYETFLRSLPGLEDLTFKYSYSKEAPFRRMLVKIKKEIVTMRTDQIDPNDTTGHYLKPETFLEWLDNEEEVVIVDTRNKYEVALGTFEKAIDPEIDSFSEFPGWVEDNLSDQKDKKIVTFCTGGIRCEKATAHMRKAGFDQVYQLEGGILKYFEETLERSDSNHWNGECVVFDKRLAVTKKLKPTTKELCYVCMVELNEQNTSEEVHPAGKPCCECADLMHAKQAERDEKGLAKHQKNMAARYAQQHQ